MCRGYDARRHKSYRVTVKCEYESKLNLSLGWKVLSLKDSETRVELLGGSRRWLQAVVIMVLRKILTDVFLVNKMSRYMVYGIWILSAAVLD
ncbi:hypothetical protein Q3G72_016547 [Acer saccharum]|nr:hypothetical protein Q3G72_016547 [Acer saccharum]